MKIYRQIYLRKKAFKLIFDIEEAFPELEFPSIEFSEIELLRNDTTETQEQEVEIEKPIAFRRTVTTDTEFQYDELKDFLKFIRDYPDRTVLTNLNLVLDEATSSISASLTMNMYGLTIDGKVPEELRFEDVPKGKDILFNSPNVEWDIDEEVVDYPSDYQEDLFITLKSIESDGYTHIIGKVVASGEESYVKIDRDEKLDAIIRIYEEDGQYYANYDIDGLYKERQAFDVQTALEMVVYSSSRSGSDDSVGMNLSVYNQTDVTLFVDVVSDDATNPRFSMKVLQGEVIEK